MILGEELSKRNYFESIMTHVSGSLPPQRYKGVITFTDQVMMRPSMFFRHEGWEDGYEKSACFITGYDQGGSQNDDFYNLLME